jgi:hypothetical protein
VHGPGGQLAPTDPTAGGLDDPPNQADRLAWAFLLSHREGNTRDAYRRDLADWWRWCADRDLDPLAVRHVDVYARALEQQGRAHATVRRLAVLSSFYRYALPRSERHPMSNFWQTVIPPALAALVAHQGGLTRTTRLRSMIRANVDLLGTLPADHPNRATLEAHIGELVDVLVRRQRRRFEPFTRAGVSFGANATAALMLLGATSSLALEEIGILHAASEPRPPREKWTFIGFYTAVGLCLAFFAFRAWRRGQREHPAQPQPTQDGLVTAGIGPWIGTCAASELCSPTTYSSFASTSWRVARKVPPERSASVPKKPSTWSRPW